MKCPKHLLGLYLDNKADTEQRTLVEEHLIGCSACREEFRQLEKLFGLLGPGDFPEPEPGFLAGILGALELERTPEELEIQRRRQIARYLGWGVLALGLGGLGLLTAMFWQQLEAAFDNTLSWLLSRLVLFNPAGFSSLAEWLSGLDDRGKALSMAVNSVMGNSSGWASLAAVGFFVWIMAREIVDDVQRLIGYKK